MSVKHTIRKDGNGTRVVILTPIRAIRLNCVECMGFQPGEVRECTSPPLPALPLQDGKNMPGTALDFGARPPFLGGFSVPDRRSLWGEGVGRCGRYFRKYLIGKCGFIEPATSTLDRRYFGMGKRWRPPRWAKPMKQEKDPGMEAIIEQLIINQNRRRMKREQEEVEQQELKKQ